MLFMNRRLRYLDPDAQPGSGAQATPTADAAGAGAETPTAETADKSKAEKTFTQAELDAIIAKRLEQQKRQALKEAEAEAEKKLAEAAEWQTLAEKRAGAIKDLEAQLAGLDAHKATAEKYGAALAAYVEKLSDGLPEAILALLEKMDPADKLEWLAANAGQFTQAGQPEAQAPPQALKRPLPQTPAANGTTAITPEERRKRAARTF